MPYCKEFFTFDSCFFLQKLLYYSMEKNLHPKKSNFIHVVETDLADGNKLTGAERKLLPGGL